MNIVAFCLGVIFTCTFINCVIMWCKLRQEYLGKRDERIEE